MRSKEVACESDEESVVMLDGNQQDQIRVLAFQLFCESGGQHGQDLEHWLAAERHVLKKSEKS